jgi:hypothetical protein
MGRPKGSKNTSPRCSGSIKVCPPEASSAGFTGMKKCPKCKRAFYVMDDGRFPNHGSLKTSWRYGE